MKYTTPSPKIADMVTRGPRRSRDLIVGASWLPTVVPVCHTKEKMHTMYNKIDLELNGTVDERT